MYEEAIIKVRCNTCKDLYYEDLDELGNGAFTARNVPERLKEQGWRITSDGRHICPLCVENGEPL